MRTSIVIATHNEGQSLRRTIASARSSVPANTEIVVVDDASTDGSVQSVRDQYPDVRVERFDQRVGVARAKHHGAQMAAGEVLIFLDAHCKPESNAFERLIENVDLAGGEAIVTPRVCALDTEGWEIKYDQTGHGYLGRLDSIQNHWVELDRMRSRDIGPNRTVYETPNFQGCVVALTRRLYQRLRGFDIGMQYWGVEDIDLGFKSWMLGHPILHDPGCTVGHRYQASFNNYEVPQGHLVANHIRMARKCLTDAVWEDWLVRFGAALPQYVWVSSWTLFQQHRSSVEQERDFLFANRIHDEFWYSKRFALPWPVLTEDPAEEEEEEEAQPFPGYNPSPSPSPSPGPSSSPSPSPSPGGYRRDTVTAFGC